MMFYYTLEYQVIMRYNPAPFPLWFLSVSRRYKDVFCSFNFVTY